MIAFGHHPDDGEGDAVDPHRRAQDGGAALISVFPKRVAGQGDGSSARTIVFGNQWTPQRGRDAGGAEVVAGDHFSVHRLDPFAQTDVDLSPKVSCGGIQNPVQRANVAKVGIGIRKISILRARKRVHGRDPAGVRDAGGAKQHRVHQTENRADAADRQRQRNNRARGKTPVQAHLSKGEANVLPHALDPTPAAHLAQSLSRARGVSEPRLRSLARSAGATALLAKRLLAHGQMEGDFVFHIPLEIAAVQQRAQAQTKLVPPAHAVSIIRAMAKLRRLQRSASTAKAFRPARVSL